MPDRSEIERRKSIKSALRDANRRQIREHLPAPAATLRELFDLLDEKLTEGVCDHTLNFTREFARNRNLSEEPLIAWLETNGGYCDCEVLANVEELFEDAERGNDDSN